MSVAALRWLAGLVGCCAAAVAVSVSPAAMASESPHHYRPQLDAATAERHQVAHYLAQGPSPWRPASVDAARWVVDFVVAADGSGTHRTVQAAIDAVPQRANGPDTQRPWVIRIRPEIGRAHV